MSVGPACRRRSREEMRYVERSLATIGGLAGVAVANLRGCGDDDRELGGSRRSTSIISRSNVPELSKNIIQKGLAFAHDWSGTVARSGSEDAQRSCPAGSVADAGLRWCGATPLSTERRISNVKGCEEIIICFECSPRCYEPLVARP
jgi:hypothetical protein